MAIYQSTITPSPTTLPQCPCCTGLDYRLSNLGIGLQPSRTPRADSVVVEDDSDWERSDLSGPEVIEVLDRSLFSSVSSKFGFKSYLEVVLFDVLDHLEDGKGTFQDFQRSFKSGMFRFGSKPNVTLMREKLLDLRAAGAIDWTY